MEVNFLIRQVRPDGTHYGWALVNRSGGFDYFVYGRGLPALAAQCRRESLFFAKGNPLTTIEEKPMMRMGDYRDATATIGDMQDFFAELKKSGAYREAA